MFIVLGKIIPNLHPFILLWQMYDNKREIIEITVDTISAFGWLILRQKKIILNFYWIFFFVLKSPWIKIPRIKDKK